MERRLKISSIISLVLTIVSVLWLIYNLVMYELLKPLMISLTPLGKLEKPAVLIGIGCMVFLIYHISAFLTYIFHLQRFRKINAFNIMVLICGIVSFLAVFSTMTFLLDITKEYDSGFDNIGGEWKFLYIFLVINAVFYLMMLVFLLSTFRSLELNKEVKPVLKDDIVFTVAQFVGIACGALGLAWIFLSIGFNAKHIADRKFWGMITGILLLLPYGLILSYWLLIKFRDRIADWYDEKQWKDLSRAGLTTLLISILLMVIFFSSTYNNLPAGVYGLVWLPFYLFSVLLIFSSCTLYFNRRA
jgi:hypothetical protein